MQSSRPAPKLRNGTADTVKAALEAIGKRTKNSHLTKEEVCFVVFERLFHLKKQVNSIHFSTRSYGT
jgi:hypothetical protein